MIIIYRLLKTVILRYILKTIRCMNIILRDYDQPFDLKINVGHCDLYFMVQWFCLMSQRLFGWVSYFQIMRQGDPNFDLKVNMTYISWSSDFVLYLQSKKISNDQELIQSDPISCPQNQDNVIMRHCDPNFDRAQSKYKSTWPIFLGLVDILNIFKIIWWMNIIVGIMDQCDIYIDLIKYM